MQISKYFASMGIEVDRASVKKVDKTLDHVENRLKKLGTFANKPIILNIGNFDVDQKKLNLALGNALDMASNKLVFEVSRFVINQAALNRDVANAMLRASGSHPLTVTPKVTPSGVVDPRVRTSHVAGAVGGGIIGRGVSGMYGPALALGLGGYGLSTLNKRNQQIVSAELGNTAVVGPENGPKSFEWLKQQGNELGFNWLEQAPEFTGFLGSATPLMGYDKSLETYKAFNEFATTRHADPVARKRALKAIQQMAAKGQVNTEELQNQLGDAANFGEMPAIFAKAYQESIGGNKTGAEAAQAIKDAMKKGQVKTGNVLPIVTRLLAEMAAPTLENSKKSSQSEQGRYQNSVNALATLASDNGVEEGFARIFRTLNAGLSESGDLVRTLSEGFNEATKWADDLLLFPQSFVRALEGKDSLVGDWLGMDGSSQLVADWKEIKTLWAEISAIKPSDLFGNFLPTIEATAREIAGIMNAVAASKQWNDNASAAADIVQADIATRGDGPVSNFFAGLGGSLAGLSAYVSAPFSVDESSQYKDQVANDYSRGAQAVADQEQLKAVSQNFEFQINLNIDPVTMAQMDVAGQADALANEFKSLVTGMFEQASVQFPTKE